MNHNIPGFHARIAWRDEPSYESYWVFIATTDPPEDADNAPGDEWVFYYAGSYPEERVREMFAFDAPSREDWYIVADADAEGGAA